jgi:anti-anti-sigma factor
MSIEVAAQTSVWSNQVEVTATGNVIDVQGRELPEIPAAMGFEDPGPRTFDVNHSTKSLRLMESQKTMSTAISASRPIDRTESYAATFTTRLLSPSVAVVTARGELDASNAQELADYALRHTERTERLVLDLSEVEFFGTAGFSALHTLNVRCAGAGVEWVLVPSHAVSRLLKICDPDSTLPMESKLPAALSHLRADQRRLLQLVSKPS